jgi:translocation and assembly module TamB
LKANGQVTATDTLFNAQVHAQQIMTGELFIDSLAAMVEGNPDSLFLSANLAARELTTEIKAELIPGEPLEISVANWDVKFKKQKWTLQQPPAIIQLDAKNYRVENFNMVSDHNELEQFISADGTISLIGEQDFHLAISGLNLENLMLLLEQEQPLSGFFGIEIDLKGNPDSLLLDSRFSISEPAFDKLKLKEISGKIEYESNRVFVETLVATDDSGKIEMSAAIPMEINVDSFNVVLPRESAVEGKINMENISLARLEEMEITDQVTGIFEGELDFSGTIEQPVMQGSFKFNETKINDYRILQFDGNLNYSENMLAADLNVVAQDSGKLEAEVGIPFRFNPDSLKFGFSPKDSVFGQVTMDKMTLESLQAIYPNATISGMIEGGLNLSGTVESPNPEGNIRLQKAIFRLPEYGIDYREIQLNLDFQRDKAVVNNLLVRSPDGNMTGTGQVNFASDFYKGDVSQSEIALKFNKFQPFNHRQFNMQVNGNASLGGKKGEVVYSGDLTIPRSEIFIPTILRMLGRIYVPELPKPVLLEELEKMEQRNDTVFIAENQSEVTDTIRFDYFENFKGNLRIRIPRNTWIKNDDMYIEVSGDLELRKNFDFFELFGSVDIVRGQYDLLGKTFIIKEGSISFQGGEEMMPTMDINASYSFRNQQRVEQILSVHVSGTADSPQVSFQLDGSSINEGDALSYILFGKSMNELTIDEQDNMADAGGASLAGKAAASILASQLTNFLGEKLAVDYIEVKSDGGFDNATVVVGKYITNDLFVSYEQRFGETHEEDLAKYEVKLEYELFRFLFFELNNSSRASGFDVIFKFDVK